jgi:hypothetical protein
VVGSEVALKSNLCECCGFDWLGEPRRAPRAGSGVDAVFLDSSARIVVVDDEIL